MKPGGRLLPPTFIDKSTLSENGGSNYFISPFNGKLINKYRYKSHLKSVGKTLVDLLFTINKMTHDDLPVCELCNKDKCRVIVDGITKSRISKTCSKRCQYVRSGKLSYKTSSESGRHVSQLLTSSDRSVMMSKANKTRAKNGNHISQVRSKSEWSRITRKSAKTALSNGNHISQRAEVVKRQNETRMKLGSHLSQLNHSSDKMRLAKSKANKTRVKKGNHPSQTHGHIYSEIGGVMHHFKSKAEEKVFRRYRRLLTKYYDREVFTCHYSNGKSYISDYKLKSEYVEVSRLPDVIEVKDGNLFRGPIPNTKSINLQKFSSVIESGMTLLIIDLSRSPSKFMITELDELYDLFMK